MSTLGEYLEYIGGCSVHRRNIMSTLGEGGFQYIGGILWDIMIYVGEQIDKSL